MIWLLLLTYLFGFAVLAAAIVSQLRDGRQTPEGMSMASVAVMCIATCIVWPAVLLVIIIETGRGLDNDDTE